MTWRWPLPEWDLWMIEIEISMQNFGWRHVQAGERLTLYLVITAYLFLFISFFLGDWCVFYGFFVFQSMASGDEIVLYIQTEFWIAEGETSWREKEWEQRMASLNEKETRKKKEGTNVCVLKRKRKNLNLERSCSEVEKALICRQLEKGRPGGMELLLWPHQSMGKCVSF